MRLTSIILLSLCLFGCASKYAPMAQNGHGYFHTQVDEDVFVVGFAGNAYTNYRQAHDQAMLRASEIGSQLDYTYMVIEGHENKSVKVVTNNGTTQDTLSTVISDYQVHNTTTIRNDISVHDYPKVELTVRYYTQMPAKPQIDLVHIPSTLASLKAKYVKDKA